MPQKRNSSIREQILRTALHLFSQQGFFNTSIHDIQREADVSMGSIYNHFGGKEAVAKALYHELLSEMEELVDGVRSDYQSTFDRGLALVRALFQMTESEPETTAFILNARHQEFLSGEPPICSSRPFIKLRDIVLEGMQRGELRQMNPWVAAAATFGPALRLISLRLDGLADQPIPSLAEEVWQVSWRAISTGDDDRRAAAELTRANSNTPGPAMIASED